MVSKVADILTPSSNLHLQGIDEGSLIHFVRGKIPQSQGTSTSTTPHMSSQSSIGMLTLENPGIIFCNPFLFVDDDNMSYSPFGNFGCFGMPDGSNRPNFEQLMDNPFVQSLLESPEFMEHMLTSNPQINRIVEENPELGNVLKDPRTLKQVMDMMKNPNLMKEMVRSTDLAIQNIETHPEGFRLLSKMFANSENDIYNSSSNSDDGKISKHDTAPEPNSKPLPNPWAKSTPNKTPQSSPFPSFKPPTTSPQSNTMPQSPNAPLGGLGSSPMGSNPMNPFNLDYETVSTYMQNPMFQETMNRIMSNPDMMQSLLSNHPMYQNGPTGSSSSPFGFNPMMFQNMGGNSSNNMPPFGLDPRIPPKSSNPTETQEPPQEKYKSQLQQLKDMGFYDEQKNLDALIATNGNVNSAVEKLLSS